MINENKDYSCLDIPEILSFIFYPRRVEYSSPVPVNSEEILFPVSDNISIGGRFHYSDKSDPLILFFHGNGEIVEDYNDLGIIFTSNGFNFLPVDYRGYGISGGRPSVSSMLCDAHLIYHAVRQKMSIDNITGKLIIAGRSLGSASALELAASYNTQIDALVIESGFAETLPLLHAIGIDTDSLKINEDAGFCNIEKMKCVTAPTLIIHGKHDSIIPVAEAYKNYNACRAFYRDIVILSSDHNTVFLEGMDMYIQGLRRLKDNIQNL